MEEKNWKPSTRLWSLTLWFKKHTSSLSFLVSGSIHSVWLSTASSRGNLRSIPHSLNNRLRWPPYTGSTFCIFLSWPHHDAKFLYDGSSVEGRDTRAEQAKSPEAQNFPALPSLSLQGSWKAEMIETRSKLTVRTSACWLLHPLRWADHPGGRCLHPDTRL